MKRCKNFCSFFNRINREIRLICIKKALIFGIVSMAIGILSWIFCGTTGKIIFLWTAPKGAMPIFFTYIIWAVSFFYIGFVFSGIIYGINKICRKLIYKDLLLLIIMQIFTCMAYPLFFCAIAPFLSFVSLLLACACCVMAIKSLLKYYSTWSILLIMHCFWLFYNAYIAISYSLIN